jgi:aspartate racemase
MSRRTIGILGGMGPLATADLYKKIIQATPARSDQEHLPVMIHADPSVPDRTHALLHNGEDPVPWLIRGAQNLARAGADFIVIPCNTAHAFLDQVQPECTIPIVNMIEEAVNEARQHLSDQGAAGILATSGTIAAGLYQRVLDAQGIRPIVPDSEHQELVMETIGRVKSGEIDANTAEPVRTAASDLESRGAGVLLAACTELPVVLHQPMVNVPLIDPTDVLARAAVRIATDDDEWHALQHGTGKVQSHAL